MKTSQNIVKEYNTGKMNDNLKLDDIKEFLDIDHQNSNKASQTPTLGKNVDNQHQNKENINYTIITDLDKNNDVSNNEVKKQEKEIKSDGNNNIIEDKNNDRNLNENFIDNNKYEKEENYSTNDLLNKSFDLKGEYFETSIIPEIELLIDNIEIDDVDSSVLLFTEKDLDYEKCQKIVKKYENNMENTVRRRNAQNIPITIIDKDCKSILNKKTYVEIMVKNILNNLRMQKRLDIFMQEHKKRHKGAQIGGGRRKTRGRLSKVVKRDSRLSNLSKMGSERSSYADSYSEDKNRRFSYNTNPALKFKNNQSSSNKPITNNISTNIKMNAKSVDKENKGRFAKDKRKINAMQTTEMFGGMDDDDEGDLDKGGFNYFTNDDKNKIKQNNISKDVDIIEERPEDEEKEREYKYKKREIRLPNKYITNINTNNNKTNNITTNNIRTNNITTNNIRTNNITTNNIKTTNNTTTTSNASSRANVYKRPIASKGGKASMSSFLMGTGKK